MARFEFGDDGVLLHVFLDPGEDSVTIPEGVSVIGGEGFGAVIGDLRNIVLPESLIAIEARAFCYEKALESIRLPESLESIGDSAFEGCKALERIEIPGSVKKIGESAFAGCDSLREVVIHDGVTEIPESMCDECENLTKVTIPPSVRKIGSGAFEYCAIQSVIVPGDAEIGFLSFDCMCSTLIIRAESPTLRANAKKDVERFVESIEAAAESTIATKGDTSPSNGITEYLQYAVKVSTTARTLAQNLQMLYIERLKFRRSDNEYTGGFDLLENFLSTLIAEAESELSKAIQHRKAVLGLNVVHPKYQEYAALCSICEYFELGRCEKLTGPDGAYNLYESELRLGAITNKLDDIFFKLDDISLKLDDIKAAQFTLYNEMKSANGQLSILKAGLDESLNQICDSIEKIGELEMENEDRIDWSLESISRKVGKSVEGINATAYNTASAAYYAKVAAEIASAPRFGIVF